MNGFFEAGTVQDFTSECSAIEHPSGQKRINIIRSSSGFVAIGNACPHKGAPFHKGTIKDIEDLDKAKIFCVLHGWTFWLKDGKSDTREYVIDVYECKSVGDVVWVSEEPKNKDVVGTRRNLQELVYNPSMGWI